MWRGRGLWAAVLCLTATAAGASGAETDDGAAPVIPNPVVMLIRDPAVQAELALGKAQIARIERAVGEVDHDLWMLRDVPVEEAAGQVRQLNDRVEQSLSELLRRDQQRRFEQIRLRAQGLVGLASAAVAEKLELTAAQGQQIRSILAEAQQAMQELQRTPTDKPDEATARRIATLNAEPRRQIGAILTDAQKQRLSELLGEPFDLSKIRRLACQAPELTAVAAWINSPPVSLARLRGRVVAVHFFTFGCINCIHNYPHYKRWHEELAERGLTVLGVHTPETSGEREVDVVRAKIKEAGLEFPVAVDNRLANWNGWANRIWPSVYLVDKQGYVRYWWYGELNWQGVEGEKFIRQKIEELLAEAE